MKWVSINHHYPTLDTTENNLLLSRKVTVQLASGETCTARWGGKIHGWFDLPRGVYDRDVIAWTECDKFVELKPYQEWCKENQRQSDLNRGIYDTSIFDDLSNFHKMTKEELAVMAGSFFFYKFTSFQK